MPKINLLESRVILPTFKFSSGWGTRKLSTKEIFGIWGLSELIPHELNAEEIIQLVPIQPLALSIRLFLDKLQPRHAKPLVASTKDLNLPNQSTYFEDIKCSINHDWIDLSVVENNSHKSDEAPVPSHMWDKRIYSSFPLRKGLNLLIKLLRNTLISVYRRKLTQSFIQYLSTTYPSLYNSYKRGHRNVNDGRIKN